MIPLIPYGGSVLGMIISLKNNARPKRKPFEARKENPIARRKKKIKKELHYKTVSAEKLNEVKENIRERMHRDERIMYFKIFIASLLVCGLLFGIVYVNNQRNAKIRERNINIRKQNEKFYSEIDK